MFWVSVPVLLLVTIATTVQLSQERAKPSGLSMGGIRPGMSHSEVLARLGQPEFRERVVLDEVVDAFFEYAHPNPDRGQIQVALKQKGQELVVTTVVGTMPDTALPGEDQTWMDVLGPTDQPVRVRLGGVFGNDAFVIRFRNHDLRALQYGNVVVLSFILGEVPSTWRLGWRRDDVARCQANLVEFTSATRDFQEQYGRLPRDLEELATGSPAVGFRASRFYETPRCPAGGRYAGPGLRVGSTPPSIVCLEHSGLPEGQGPRVEFPRGAHPMLIPPVSPPAPDDPAADI